jgi:hypothetical protein
VIAALTIAVGVVVIGLALAALAYLATPHDPFTS